MRTSAALLLLAMPLAAAPVPKVKENTFERKLLGTWRHLKPGDELVPSKAAYFEFSANGVVEMSMANTGVRSIVSGKYVIHPANDPFEAEIELTFPGGKKGEALWIVRTLSDEGLKVVDPTAGVSQTFEREKAER